MGYEISIRQAADRLGISDQAVHKRIRSGTLDAVKVNKHWLVSEESVEYALISAPKPGRPREGLTFLLMNGPYPVMEFSYRESSMTFIPREVMDATRAPIGTVGRNGQGLADGLRYWWEHRSIPASRAGMDEKLRRLGLEDPSQIPFQNLGLSLSDQYWICPSGESLNWSDLNYFDNSFDEDDDWNGWLDNVGLSTPDNTSEGALPKKWVCRGEDRILLKGHIPWTDQQVYNEAVAALLHQKVLDKHDYVPYHVERIDGLGVVSACPCFITPDEEYVPASLVLESEGKRRGESDSDALMRISKNLGISTRETELFVSKMIACDSIIANTDRHLRNFGFIRNIHDLSWRFAPLFDSGNSLWYDKDEGAVAREDHTFTSRPLDPNPNRQVALAPRLEWLDPSDLEGLAEEAAGILEQGDLSRWRTDYLRKGIQKRIDVVLSML